MPGPRTRLAPLLTLLAAATATAAPARGDGPPAPATTPEQADFFERRVRPVLAGSCFGCHGPKAAKAGLRLDSRAAVLAGSDSGPVVTPGDPNGSLLIEAVRRAGALKMPPKTALDPEAVADLEAWVRMGLPWPDATGRGVSTNATAGDPEPWRRHWAFRPVRDPGPPSVRDRAWARTSVDPFVLGALEAKGLAPSPEADRRTLIRRASFDLLGLPPAPEDVEAFAADPAPDAYERLIDRLLASPHYGERWGRHWLDVARYADTKGYVFFEDANFPWAYTYRDYVVRALNEDMPYDRFLDEQIAADRLPTPGGGKGNGRTLAALGFLSLGGRFMNNPHDVIDDRIDVVTRGLMGLTVACARCHDHKFDPVPAEDYYALYGVFASTAEPAVPPLLDDPPDTPRYRAFEAELRAREAKLAAFVDGKRAELTASAKSRAAEYLLAAHAARGRPSTDEFMLIADGNDLNPTMVVRWRTFLDRTRRRHDPVFTPWHALAALPESDFAPRASAYCSKLASEPDLARPVNPLLARALATSPPASLADAARVYAGLLNAAEADGQEHARRSALNGQPRPGPLPVAAYQQLYEVFHGPDAPPDLDPNAINALALLPDRPSQAKLQELEKAVETWRATGPGAPPRAMALVDTPSPVTPRVFLRGNPNAPGPAVPRRFLTALSGPGARAEFTEGSGRLELARAIASADNPLTARVLVNRVWMYHFGAPLVATPGDFGLRSDPPTNLDLLDHLAFQFTHADGWSLKALHRRVMLSSAYRQSSADRPEARAVDPENTLLWRMNRRRLDFEALRDALLAVSGRLDRTMGGPPVADLAAPASTRRTLYGKIDRLNLPGLYRTFDFPDPSATSPKRDATTVPPQALFLLNHPFTLAAAKALANRADVICWTDLEARVDRLYHLLYGRAPTGEELDLARGFVADPEGGWERYAQALLMSNEFAFID
jgi:hypothetical protein